PSSPGQHGLRPRHPLLHRRAAGQDADRDRPDPAADPVSRPSPRRPTRADPVGQQRIAARPGKPARLTAWRNIMKIPGKSRWASLTARRLSLGAVAVTAVAGLL